MEVATPSSHPSRLPQRPIWAPDPAVPLIARMLAYLFAVLMLFTVIRSNTYVRPTDSLLYPQQWHNYAAGLCTMTYPSGWRVIDQSERSLAHVYFVYSTAGPSYVETMVQQSSGQITPEMLNDLSQHQEALLEGAIPGYRQRTATADDSALTGWHFFSANAAEPNAPSVIGAWALCAQGNRTLFLLARSSPANWSTMAEISSTMLTHAVL